MKNRHVQDLLSAYLDGEAKHPERIAAHLAECPDCARRHETLQTLRNAIRELPQPAARPGFAQRVGHAASKADTAARRVSPRTILGRRAPFPFAVPTALAAILFLSFTTVALLFSNRDQPGTIDLTSDEAVVTELARLLEDGADVGIFETSFGVADVVPQHLSDSEALSVLAATAQEAYASADAYAQAEADALLDSMTAEEYETLRALLEASQSEER